MLGNRSFCVKWFISFLASLERMRLQISILQAVLFFSLTAINSIVFAQGSLRIEQPLEYAHRVIKAKPQRGEYESTIQFKKRYTGIDWQSKKFTYLLLDSLTTASACKYDPDKELFTMEIPNLDENYTNNPDCDIPTTCSAIMQKTIVRTGSYLAQNAFGATINTVIRNQTLVSIQFLAGGRTEGRDTLLGVWINELSRLKDSCDVHKNWGSGIDVGVADSTIQVQKLRYSQWKSWNEERQTIQQSLDSLTRIALQPIQIRINIPREKARTFRKNIRLVLGVTLESPLDDACVLKSKESPTFNHPFEDHITEYRLQCRMVEVVAYDISKQKVIISYQL